MGFRNYMYAICRIFTEEQSMIKNEQGRYIQQFTLSNEDLTILYIDKKMSAREIANQHKINTRTVTRWLAYYNIPRRSHREYKTFLGRNHTEATKQRISNVKKGRPSNSSTKIRPGVHLSRKTEFRKGIQPRTKFKPSDPRLMRENNPRWKGGYTPYYGPNWREQRRKALQHDVHICQRCRATENGREHDVHHIIRFYNFGLARYKEANDLSNLITLCRTCHRIIENDDIPLEEIAISRGEQEMSDGELKRRISEKAHTNVPECNMWGEFPGAINLNDLEKILNEIALEFHDFSLTSPTGEATVALYELIVKWFGLREKVYDRMGERIG